MFDLPEVLCACGCGKVTVTGAAHRKGHHMRVRQYDLSRYREEDCGHSTPCWIWTGNIRARDGYGQTHFRGKVCKPHRVFYELLVGAIPEGLTLDHLCRTKACVNPAHLEPVTAAENLRRQYRAGAGAPAELAKRTHCVRGHELTPENSYRIKKWPNARNCRKCRNMHAARSRERAHNAA